MNNPVMFNSQMFSDYFNLQPSEVKGRANAGVDFYRRLLYTKIYSTFNFKLPKEWRKNYFRFLLFHYGSLAVIYTKEFGWVAQPYSITKLDIYYNPKVIEVYNQNIKERKIGIVGTNAGIIKCMDDYYGLDDIVTRYATMLAQCDKNIEINLMNSNVTAFFEAENKKQAETVKEAYGKATTGVPFVVVNSDVMNDKAITTMFPDVKGNFIANDLLQARRSILNAFLTEIGIRNANYDKRERLNSQEVSENNDETRAIISVIYDNIKMSMEEINKFSDLNLSVELAYDYSEGEEVNTWVD